jgi:hypothetical protein
MGKTSGQPQVKLSLKMPPRARAENNQMLKGLGWTVLSWRAALAAERAAIAAPRASAAREERQAGMTMAGGQPPAKRKTPPVVSKLFHW